ncbi:histidine phosphatase family protein [Lachnospiraceae bacterium OttesenSCG-928-E19]|nr:histidine phosphatase family protein [Lachnospiraceae bacterium OttesenSCG-928-E19]
MIDKVSKNIILLRHGEFDSSSKSIDITGFMQAMIVAKYLRDNKFPLPSAFIASTEKRTVQMSKIISSSLTRKAIPVYQERMIYGDALYGIEDAVNNPERALKDSNFIICVSHQPGLESSFKRCGIEEKDYQSKLKMKEPFIRVSDTFLLTAPTWEEMLALGGNIQIKHLISPASIRFYDKPGMSGIKQTFERNFTNGDIEKIPLLLEEMRNNQKLRESMIGILNSSVNTL